MYGSERDTIKYKWKGKERKRKKESERERKFKQIKREICSLREVNQRILLRKKQIGREREIKDKERKRN